MFQNGFFSSDELLDLLENIALDEMSNDNKGWGVEEETAASVSSS